MLDKENMIYEVMSQCGTNTMMGKFTEFLKVARDVPKMTKSLKLNDDDVT
jgi:hypothetical protein